MEPLRETRAPAHDTAPIAEEDHQVTERSMSALRRRARCIALCTFLGISGLMADSSAASNNDAQNFPPAPGAGQEVYPPSKGGWIANAPSGYYLGRVFKHDRVRRMLSSPSKDYVYSLIYHGVGDQHIEQCGWIMSEVVTLKLSGHKGKKRHHHKHAQQPVAQPCKKDLIVLKDRDHFGKGFNCLPNQCVDGTAATPLTSTCDYSVYYNYLPITRASTARRERTHTSNGFYNYAGQLATNALVHYRYTTLDDQAAVIRTSNFNWGYIEKSCIAGYPQGGVPKPSATSNTAPQGLSVELVTTPLESAGIGQLNLQGHPYQETVGASH